MSGRTRLERWGPARVALALLALALGVATARAFHVAGAPAQLALVYGALVLGAVQVPAAITLQVVAGQVLLAGWVLRSSGPLGPEALLRLGATLFAVVATAELLAAVARLDLPVRRGASGELPRTAFAASLAALCFLLLLPLRRVPGPGGLAGVLAAALGFLVLAGLLRVGGERG
ncbi:MAG: hypothetical protein R3E98_09265 [Gemmatimonadota bacterium]